MTARKVKPVPPDDVVEIDLARFAEAWKVTGLALGRAALRPVLGARQFVQYPTGLRVIATDSYMVVAVWLGVGPGPDYDVVPQRTVAMADTFDLVSVVLRAVRKEDIGKVEPVTVDMVAGTVALLGTTVTMKVFEDYPDALLHLAEERDGASFGMGEPIARLQKVGKVLGPGSVGVTLGDGPLKSVEATVPGRERTEVLAVAMPVRTR